MSKKILVTKEWHKEAMFAMHEADKYIEKSNAFMNGLRSFLVTKLTPEQQIALESEIESFMQDFEE
ncbi:hypothetical protein NVP1181O_31 [Vibrio phage 1.181.O._10N.286.46.C9]|nr:hypothetical protein NVP1181O_31 [Vibrio phage 1.181.O._10N.286.46.C9]